jgi:hypothetical protein
MSTLPRSESGDFPWWGDDQDIVLRDQVATAVYRNRHGGVVIRQQRQWDEEGDTTIIIGRENAIRVVYALLRAAGHDDIQLYRTNGIGCEDVPDPADDDLKPSDGDEEEQDGEPDQAEFRLIENTGRPKDATAAERQRRHREWKRNGLAGVTGHGPDRDSAAASDQNGGEAGTGELPGELFPEEVHA